MHYTLHMYPNIPIWLSLLFVGIGIGLLAWSADRFVDGACVVAKRWGISPFIIVMVIIGFGTSAPEMAVSALSSASGHSDLSLGNAYGSNIFNIAVILGMTALLSPVRVKTTAISAGVPLLVVSTVLPYALLKWGHGFSRMDGIVLLLAFALLLPLSCWIDAKTSTAPKEDPADSAESNLAHPWLWILVGLSILVGSSHLLVWGAVDMARALGVSELAIGLTIVAAGTSLPELASAIASARKGQNDFVIGNIVGSNFFNALAVVGLAGTINPFTQMSPLVLSRDLPATLITSLALAFVGFNFRHPKSDGVITRGKGIVLMLLYGIYLMMLFRA